MSASVAGPVTDALYLLVTLEYLSSELYRRALAAPAFAAGPQALTPGERSALGQISAHEEAHVGQLTTMLGVDAPPRPAPDTTYDFSGGGTTRPNSGPFVNAFTVKSDLLKLAQLIADIGLRAYKGQLRALASSPASLGTALRIHNVDARHAAEIRILRTAPTATAYASNLAPWITGAAFDSGFNAAQAEIARLVYGPAATMPGASLGEDNLVQGKVTLPNAVANTQAFDEPLSADAITAFLGLFGAA